MKVALIGATGFVGSSILRELSTRGHQVTAIARKADKVSTPLPGVKAQQGDVSTANQVAALVKGHDAVISAYNAGWTNPSLYDDFLAGSRAIQEGIKHSGVKRYLVIGGAGSLEVAPGVQLVDTPGFPAEYIPGATAARDYLNILKQETTLDWTFFSPAIEMNPHTSGTRKGAYRTGLNSPVFDAQGRSVLSVEDLAVAIVDELEQPKHIRERFTAAY